MAFTLGCYPNHAQAVAGLLKLTSDSDVDVRDWAVFGLGVQGEADFPEIRDALVRSLGDADENVREESAIGLGKRRDGRLLPWLLLRLDEPVLGMRVAKRQLLFSDWMKILRIGLLPITRPR